MKVKEMVLGIFFNELISNSVFLLLGMITKIIYKFFINILSQRKSKQVVFLND